MSISTYRPNRGAEMVALPGLVYECRVRGWAANHLAQRTGLSWEVANKAVRGEPISPSTHAKIIAALKLAPVTELERRLLEGRR